MSAQPMDQGAAPPPTDGGQANAGRDDVLLSVRDLSVDFQLPKGPIHAVRGVSFDIQAGETVALVGESGSGKSVTALSIAQLLPYPQARHPSGSILFRGNELVGADPAVMENLRGSRIAMIFQEPQTSLNPVHTIEKQIRDMLFLHDEEIQDTASARTRILELLNLVGINNPGQRLGAYPHELSGGQCQRVMIAMALANNPDLLIADEPTTALDVTIQAQVLDLLEFIRVNFNMAMLFITHDLGIVGRIADRVCVMNDGEIVESGPVADVLERPHHTYTRHLLAAEPSGEPEAADPEAAEVLACRNLRVHFPIRKGLLRRTVGFIKAVDGVTLAVREGETVGIVGESGSGKTTLAMAALRLETSTGEVIFRGRAIQDLEGNTLRPLRREMQVVFQDPFASLNPRMSIGQIIEEGMKVHNVGEDDEARDNLVAEMLAEVDLDPDSRWRYPHEFSGGQRQRITLARAMVLRPKLLVLDEPTSALDRSVQAQIVDLLVRLQRSHRLAFLFISHDLKVVRALAHHLVVLREGQVMEHGPAEQVFSDPQHPYTKALLAAAFNLRAEPDLEAETTA